MNGNEVALQNALSAYLASVDPHVDLTRLTASRTSRVYTDTWRPWLEASHIDGYGTLDEQTAQLAAELLRDPAVFALPGKSKREGHRDIGRQELTRLSAAATERHDDDAYLRLWIAAMMWGSGATNGRGPRNLRKSLTDPRLPTYLARSAARVARGEPDRYNMWTPENPQDSIEGVQLAFRSKWLWAVSLSEPPKVLPLILDSRVRASLDAVSTAWGKTITYSEYVLAAHEVAKALGNFGPATGETVEYLLFERRAESGKSRAPFTEWRTSSQS